MRAEFESERIEVPGLAAKKVAPDPRNGSKYLQIDVGNTVVSVLAAHLFPPAHLRNGRAISLGRVSKAGDALKAPHEQPVFGP